jgi:hypothetical protein
MSLLALDQLLSQPGNGMYLPDKQLSADPYKDKVQEDMLIQQQIMIAENSGGEEQSEVKQPKKRAETWVQEETLCLIALRREVDGHFNTSKSNRYGV